MNTKNSMQLQFEAISNNEAFVRASVAAFISPLDPTIEELMEIKTAVSEAVTNSIIHGYENIRGSVKVTCTYEEDKIQISVEDEGRGIENIEKAREPLYTSKPELERSGMGFTVMEIFMDSVMIESEKNLGTKVTMIKKLGR